MKLNDKEKLICIKSIFDYKEGERYKFRFDSPGAIYVYYKAPRVLYKGVILLGNKFWLEEHNDWIHPEYFRNFFITIKEYRKLKLQKLNEL